MARRANVGSGLDYVEFFANHEAEDLRIWRMAAHDLVILFDIVASSELVADLICELHEVTSCVSLRPPCVAADRHGSLIRAIIFVMETQRAPRVISADTLLRRGVVVITFDDSKCARLRSASRYRFPGIIPAWRQRMRARYNSPS